MGASCRYKAVDDIAVARRGRAGCPATSHRHARNAVDLGMPPAINAALQSVARPGVIQSARLRDRMRIPAGIADLCHVRDRVEYPGERPLFRLASIHLYKRERPADL